MGNATSRVTAKFLRPIRNYNIRERALKFIEKDKQQAPPRYPTEEKILKLQTKVIIDEKTELNLLENLKHVYVTTPATESLANQVEKAEPRSLPRFRGSIDYGVGYVEPKIIPEGRISLKKAVDLIADHAIDPVTNNVTVLSKVYKLPEEDVESIVKYFQGFQIHMPDDESNIPKWFLPSSFQTKPQVHLPKETKK